MRLLKILKAITGDRYSVISLWKTPRQLGVDSLTFTDFVLRLEERYSLQFTDSEMVALYRLRLKDWRKQPLFRKKRKGER